ncbi:MAG TPA: ATP-binding cassette domain-containing protein, partial [Oceanipulchritudo sp.]|nr:ATP-binding cassette domain-containing protein [Oceanipulchritudo sp.]
MSEVIQNSILRAEGLAKSYRSGQRDIQVLLDVSLSLGKGETVSIRGESGSGKSTLLNLLAGIETPDKGEIHWNGQSLLSLPEAQRPARRASYLGFVFQAFYLIPELNTLENVLLATRIAGTPYREGKA